MTARARVYVVVAVAALAAAGAAVGVTLATRTALPEGQPGAPPLSLDLGLRADPEARALGNAVRLYNAGRRSDAGEVFARYDSLEAEVGQAMARWPKGALQELEVLGEAHRRSGLVQLNLGLALLWTGLDTLAGQAFTAAVKAEPDTPYAVTADTLLHPGFYKGLPPFTPSFGTPAALAQLAPGARLAALERRAAGGDVRARLLYGAALQSLGRPVSAERQFTLAAKAAPDDPEAQAAAAVGLFDKQDPSKAFSRLGPLAKRFPEAATVRFHLGLLLVWMADVPAAKKQFTLAAADDPRGPIGRAAQQFLASLGNVRTK